MKTCFLCSLIHNHRVSKVHRSNANSLCVCVRVCVCVLHGRSLQAEAFGVGDGDGEFVFELLPVSIRRQTDLIEAGVRDRQPAEKQSGDRVNRKTEKYSLFYHYSDFFFIIKLIFYVFHVAFLHKISFIIH